MTQFSWQKLDNGSWGVKASGDYGVANTLAGQTVTVVRRDGTQSQVKLGARIDAWNGGRAAVYSVARTTAYANATRRPQATRLTNYEHANPLVRNGWPL